MTLLEDPVSLVDRESDRRVRAHSDPPAPSDRQGITTLLWTSLLVLGAFAVGLFLFLVVIGGFQHRMRQTVEYNAFRKALAAGTAPTGQETAGGSLVQPGTPVALLTIPSIGVDEVVDEGTSSQVLISGPGHQRDTVLPGQPGTSVVVGRQFAYGGPFRRLHSLRPGDLIDVTVGFGTNKEQFKVIDVRHAGSPQPLAPAAGDSRLTLVTGYGSLIAPSGLLYVDADLVGQTQPSSPIVLGSSALPRSELAGHGDTGQLWALLLWLEALAVVVGMATWSYSRWGRRQTWIVFVPLGALVAFYVSDQVARTLPNVL